MITKTTPQPTRVILTVLVSIFLLLLSGPSANAAPVTGFDSGRIIDDAIFTNSSSMSVGSIQSFLNSKVPICDTSGSKPSEFGGGTRAQWGTARGYPPPYTCLRDYSEGGITSAQIIYNKSQQYQINPQVLMVLLQKEQGLVTDEWPTSNQYRTATGYGCPDTAPCDSQYYGLTNQIDWAAKMFRAIMNASPTWYTPYVLGNNFIRWSPNSSCGGSTVNIQNRSTQALYNYTPYQPNQAALNAGYGMGDACSAYGNRNFYQYFKDWFGSTHVPAYRPLHVRQGANPTLIAGQGWNLFIDYKNFGSLNWYDDTSSTPQTGGVHLAATQPMNRSSPFGYGWPGVGRPALQFSKVFEGDGVTLASNQHVVEPGQIARFEFPVAAPWSINPGVYREHFQLVLEGNPSVNWNMGGLAWFDISIRPTYEASYISQCSMPTMTQNSTAECYIRYKNTGGVRWYDDISRVDGSHPIHLATSTPINRFSSFGAAWPDARRAALNFAKVLEADNVTLAPNQHIAEIGQIVEFRFTVTASDMKSPNLYREHFQPVAEGSPNWAMGGLSWLDFYVSSNNKKATLVDRTATTTAQRGTGAPVSFSYRNTSNTPWYDSVSAPLGIAATHLAATNHMNRLSIFSYNWPSAGRPLTTFSKVYESNGVTLAPNQHRVNPGQIAQFDFPITIPWALGPGTYREHFQLVNEISDNWNLSESVSWVDITVTP